MEIYGNLQTSKTLGKMFAKHKLIDCKRQSSNLKRLLCSSNISTKTSKTTKGEKFAFVVIILRKLNSLNLRIGINHFFFKSSFNYETSNPTYVIIYSGWNKEYIGQTGG